jgi:hypothetical protein
MDDAITPPGPALRDPRYQDLCTFFKTMPDGEGWKPHIGDWVVRRPGEGLGVVITSSFREAGCGNDHFDSLLPRWDG